MEAQAHMGAAAERHPGIFVAGADRLGREAQRIEPVRFRPMLGHAVGVGDRHADEGAGRDAVAGEDVTAFV